MLKNLIKYAEIVKNKYRFEIDGCIDSSSIFRDKFKADQEKWKKICNNLYKKLTY